MGIVSEHSTFYSDILVLGDAGRSGIFQFLELADGILDVVQQHIRHVTAESLTYHNTHNYVILDIFRQGVAHIRRHFTPAQIELRVDANGAFSPADALEKLHRLSEFQLHSIEQPIRAGQWNEMARLCAATPFPIALDEELIGINRRDRKIELLETIRPQYIILKPSLHGGISGSEEWMELAAERGIGSWVTSALESNIGLNAIAQWCATLQPALPQGLGTGLLFTDNIDYPLHIEGDCLWFHPEEQEPDLLNWLKQ